MLVINKAGGASCEQGRESRPATLATSEAPLLALNGTEAARMAYSGRSWPALKESKTFDSARIAELPLFAKEGRLF